MIGYIIMSLAAAFGLFLAFLAIALFSMKNRGDVTSGIIILLMSLTFMFIAYQTPVKDGKVEIINPEYVNKTNGVTIVTYKREQEYVVFTSRDTGFFFSTNIVIKKVEYLNVVGMHEMFNYEVLTEAPKEKVENEYR